MAHTILIVDDEPQIRETLRRALRQAPYRILDVGGAGEALEMIEQEPPDVLLSDHHMPGMTGLALCQEVQRRQPTIVRILLTGAGDANLATEAVATDAVYHVLEKPWDGRELLLLLRLAVRHRADQCELARLAQLVKAQRRLISELEAQSSTGSST